MKNTRLSSKKLVIVSVPYKPFLGIVKNGCSIDDVSFITIEYRKHFIWKVLFRIFLILHFFTLAAKCKISNKNYIEFKTLAQDPSTRFLFWGQHYLDWWYPLCKQIPQKKKFCFCWGPLENTSNVKKRVTILKRMQHLDVSFYTMNPYDAQKYKMILTTQFYRHFDNVLPKEGSSDFYFIGYKKGREEHLNALKTSLEERGYKTDFHLLDLSEPETSFEENVSMVLRTHCIVDIVATKFVYKQDGLTLRPLEALFTKKKLVTNYQAIKEHDFYHPANIFIINSEKLDLSGIDDFFNAPMFEFDKTIIEQYEVNNWIKKYFL